MLLSRQVDVGTGLVGARTHYTRHDIPGANHHGLPELMCTLRPWRRVHGLPLDGVDQAVAFELVRAVLVAIVWVHIGLLEVLRVYLRVHQVDGLVAA